MQDPSTNSEVTKTAEGTQINRSRTDPSANSEVTETAEGKQISRSRTYASVCSPFNEVGEGRKGTKGSKTYASVCSPFKEDGEGRKGTEGSKTYASVCSPFNKEDGEGRKGTEGSKTGKSGIPTDCGYTERDANACRLYTVCFRYGTAAMREAFEKIRPKGPLKDVLRAHKRHLDELKYNGVLSVKEWQTLFPSRNRSVTVEEMDISLLMKLFRCICGFGPPNNCWEELPPEDDNTWKAHVFRIWSTRNAPVCHRPDTPISNDEFETRWKVLKKAITGLLGQRYEVAIDNMKEGHIDPRAQDWCKEELAKLRKRHDAKLAEVRQYYESELAKSREEYDAVAPGGDVPANPPSSSQENGLVHFDISNSKIGDKGRKDLLTASDQHKSLRYLDLSDTCVSDKGASAIASSLKLNITLNRLDLSKSSIGDEGASELADMLRCNKSLRELDLSNRKGKK